MKSVTRPGIYRVSARLGGDKTVSYESDQSEDIVFELPQRQDEPADKKTPHQ